MADSAISKLAAKPLSHQIGILILILAVLFGLYYQLQYSTMGDELSSSTQQYGREEGKSKDLKQKEVEWKKMFKDKESLDVKLSTNQVSLPRTAALPSFIGNLQRQAAVSGVSFKNWSRKDELPAGSYVKVPVSIEVVGSFHQILKYFFLLGKTKRIITIENFSLKPESVTSDEVLLKASFLATTFRQADGVKFNTSAQEKKKIDPIQSGVDRLKNPGGMQ